MYEEIDQLKQPEYKRGQKYTIETKVVKNESKANQEKAHIELFA